MNTFIFKDQPLRTIEIDGEPWFHATDACKCLGLSLTAGTFPHLARIDNDERKRLTKSTLSQTLGGPEFVGRAGMVNAINESGLNRLTLRADSAKAKPFQDWVVKEVLPSIRRTGGYLLNEEARQTAAVAALWQLTRTLGD